MIAKLIIAAVGLLVLAFFFFVVAKTDEWAGPVAFWLALAGLMLLALSPLIAAIIEAQL